MRQVASLGAAKGDLCWFQDEMSTAHAKMDEMTKAKKPRKTLLAAAAAARAVIPVADTDRLILELVGPQLEKNLVKVREEIEASRGRSLSERIERVVETFSSQFLGQRTTLKLVLDQISHPEKIRNILSSDVRLTGLIRRELNSHREELRPRDLDLALFVVFHSLIGIVRAAILDHPVAVTDAELNLELVRLTRTYLVRSPD